MDQMVRQTQVSNTNYQKLLRYYYEYSKAVASQEVTAFLKHTNTLCDILS